MRQISEYVFSNSNARRGIVRFSKERNFKLKNSIALSYISTIQLNMCIQEKSWSSEKKRSNQS
jgi:hypothetical protein